ncbi:BAF_collapsed_G0010120.mRNA.1.CDS.1 [Saccharomyces cerevisiae]|nr:BMC_2a_G0010210.mRNA.1.CDS.1 [Saccharomyces cerevisiae]CAI4345156.1 BMB_G0010180.mRNA.1.CDS.1 [Saccharomyces cerevisiae]CAI4352042.1 AKH_1a_G0009980.mRNA.1.CDS.1 [Saccharomyces cerevisiae]CAI5248073.1 BAF_HP2_G0009670.mRNA.1.CDS.1 [Saccharomyces cerevisiae]CAI5248195.1 BFH_HP2_G0009570.mRNA.1.CDS.1 [Saccharomyces cerevisiae]
MQFSTVASIAAIAAVASAASNITTATVTEESTTLVTITSCEDHVCSETVSPALVSTATVTVNDVITQYTTWCPLPTTEAPKNTTSPAPTEKPTQQGSSTQTVTSYTGAAVKALPAAGALLAGAAALLL